LKVTQYCLTYIYLYIQKIILYVEIGAFVTERLGDVKPFKLEIFVLVVCEVIILL